MKNFLAKSLTTLKYLAFSYLAIALMFFVGIVAIGLFDRTDSIGNLLLEAARWSILWPMTILVVYVLTHTGG